MIACMVAAPSSGSGKTAVTCALLALLARRGLAPCAFKCGPDYIDPMFHRSVLGVESHNVDLFFSSESFLRQHYTRHCAGHRAVVCEGVMGFYDGVGGTTSQASAWHVAHTLDVPVLLVIRPRGASLTLAAQIRGLCAFREQSYIRGLFLNDCSPMLYRSLAPMLEKETGLPVLGYLPHREEAAFESRHLGLYTAGEIRDLQQRISLLADLLEQNLDFTRFSSLFCTPEPVTDSISQEVPAITRLAIASDRAFCFCYEETKEALRAAGAELVPFSPLTDTQLPENIGGLYLSGGYPELYANELAKNEPMLYAIRKAVENGMPTVAECGGFLYLGQHLEGSDGISYPMAGVLPGDGVRKEKLTRFGYAFLTSQSDSLLFSAGEQIPVHEFHYWDSTENGAAFLAQKPVTGRSWSCGFATPTLYAGFPHLYGAGHPQWVRRFTHAASEYQKSPMV